MKKYFEYHFDEETKKKLLDFYENTDITMHTSQTERKSRIKMERILKKVDFGEMDIVLDIGCSSGELLKMIHTRIKKGIGIDLSSNIIDLNKRKNIYANISYEVFDGVHFEFPVLMDKICMLDVLEHAFEPRALLESAYKNLKRGGVLILEVPSTGWLSELIFGKYHMGHLRYYDPNSIKYFLENQGFHILNIDVYNAVPAGVFMLKRGTGIYRIMNWLCNIIPKRIYPYYGSILVTCRKL